VLMTGLFDRLFSGFSSPWGLCELSVVLQMASDQNCCSATE